MTALWFVKSAQAIYVNLIKCNWGGQEAPCVFEIEWFFETSMPTVFEQAQFLAVPPFNELSYEIRERRVKDFLSQLNIEVVRSRSHIPCIPSDVAISQGITADPYIYERV